MENKDIKLEEIDKAFKEYFGKENPNAKPFNPFMENTKWTDEDGNKFSSWKIGDDLYTGDGGAEMFMELMKKEAEKYKI